MTEDLTRLCDACGKMIGGGYNHCPKCNIYLCVICGIELMYYSKEYPIRCPMCGEKLK